MKTGVFGEVFWVSCRLCSFLVAINLTKSKWTSFILFAQLFLCHHAQHNKSYSYTSSWIFIIYDRTFSLFLNFIFGVSFLSSLAFLCIINFLLKPFTLFECSALQPPVTKYWFVTRTDEKCLYHYLLSLRTVSFGNVLKNLHSTTVYSISKKLLLFTHQVYSLLFAVF